MISNVIHKTANFKLWLCEFSYGSPLSFLSDRELYFLSDYNFETKLICIGALKFNRPKHRLKVLACHKWNHRVILVFINTRGWIFAFHLSWGSGWVKWANERVSEWASESEWVSYLSSEWVSVREWLSWVSDWAEWVSECSSFIRSLCKPVNPMIGIFKPFRFRIVQASTPVITGMIWETEQNRIEHPQSFLDFLLVSRLYPTAPLSSTSLLLYFLCSVLGHGVYFVRPLCLFKCPQNIFCGSCWNSRRCVCERLKIFGPN